MRKCKSDDIALKSYFLGPQAENANYFISSIIEIANQYANWRKSLFPMDGYGIGLMDQTETEFLLKQNQMKKETQHLSRLFEKEFPLFSPRYLGHMLSELSLPGLFGHFVALLHNPNNVSKESSHVGLRIEKEAIEYLGKMLNWKDTFGHFTSGGTIANLEAILRMRAQLDPAQWAHAKLLTSNAAHYSWKKNLKISGLPESALVEIPLDNHGRLSTLELSRFLKSNSQPILGLVSLFGSTESGTIDDIEKINQIIRQQKTKIWHHVDAAYGGFFACVKDKSLTYLNKQIRALRDVTSVTLDPHKLGYVPYGCGAFLCHNKKHYVYANINAPYLKFSSKKDVGVQSIEGSRPATGAAGTWLTAKTLGLNQNGLGKVLNRQIKVKGLFEKQLKKNIKSIIFTNGLDLNILCWTIKTKKSCLSHSNQVAESIYQKIPTIQQPFFVSKTTLDLSKHHDLAVRLKKQGLKLDSNKCTLIRMTLMNPFLMTKESETKFIETFIEQIKLFLH